MPGNLYTCCCGCTCVCVWVAERKHTQLRHLDATVTVCVCVKSSRLFLISSNLRLTGACNSRLSFAYALPYSLFLAAQKLFINLMAATCRQVTPLTGTTTTTAAGSSNNKTLSVTQRTNKLSKAHQTRQSEQPKGIVVKPRDAVVVVLFVVVTEYIVTASVTHRAQIAARSKLNTDSFDNRSQSTNGINEAMSQEGERPHKANGVNFNLMSIDSSPNLNCLNMPRICIISAIFMPLAR